MQQETESVDSEERLSGAHVLTMAVTYTNIQGEIQTVAKEWQLPKQNQAEKTLTNRIFSMVYKIESQIQSENVLFERLTKFYTWNYSPTIFARKPFHKSQNRSHLYQRLYCGVLLIHCSVFIARLYRVPSVLQLGCMLVKILEMGITVKFSRAFHPVKSFSWKLQHEWQKTLLGVYPKIIFLSDLS